MILIKKGAAVSFLCFVLLITTARGQVARTVAKIPQPDTASFVNLNFAVKDEVCSVRLNPAYRSKKPGETYPLSLFITVNTLYHDKNGFPTPAEASAFKQLEGELLKSLQPFSYCYVGKTMMNGSRDIILYIRRADQQKISSTIGAVKLRQPRIKEYVFEEDPKWEAVAEFYEGLK